MDELKEKALAYHCMDGKPGKIQVIPSKPCATANDLSLAYTPGVAKPVLEIAENPQNAYKYTSKGNLVAVVSNGTAYSGWAIKERSLQNPLWKEKAFCLNALPTSTYST